MELSLDVRNWWVYVLRGAAAVAFGVLTWVLPGMALLTLVFLFGAYAIVDGGSALAATVEAKQKSPNDRPRWLLVVYGIVSILAGVIAFTAPGITAFALLMLIAARALVLGTLEIAAAIRLRKEIQGEWLLALSGVLSILFGGVLFLVPGPGALGVLLWIGAWAVVIGALLVALGVRLRSIKRRAFGDFRGGMLSGSH